jgi:hypothetical protein
VNTVSIKRWNGTFDRPGMIATIWRKIEAAQSGGTVMIDFEGAVISAAHVTQIICGFPLHKVKFVGHPTALPHPLPAGVKPDTPPGGGASAAKPKNEPEK